MANPSWYLWPLDEDSRMSRWDLLLMWDSIRWWAIINGRGMYCSCPSDASLFVPITCHTTKPHNVQLSIMDYLSRIYCISSRCLQVVVFCCCLIRVDIVHIFHHLFTGTRTLLLFATWHTWGISAHILHYFIQFCKSKHDQMITHHKTVCLFFRYTVR